MKREDERSRLFFYCSKSFEYYTIVRSIFEKDTQKISAQNLSEDMGHRVRPCKQHYKSHFFIKKRVKLILFFVPKLIAVF